MKKIILIFFLLSSKNSYCVLNLEKIISPKEIVEESIDLVKNLGLNCPPTPHNINIAKNEFLIILNGLFRVSTDALQILIFKKNFPNACHVLTNKIIEENFFDNDVETKRRVCVLKNPFTKGCSLFKTVADYDFRPSYYWPKYFIEVSEKGNDSLNAFSDGNTLFILNRKFAELLEKEKGTSFFAEKTTTLLNIAKPILKKMGLDIGSVNAKELVNLKFLKEFGDLRVRASKDGQNSSFDVQIWPVALSETIAEHLTVCGPELVKEGKHAGGYGWPLKAIPMLCPIAQSTDAREYWDTGIIDYIDPLTTKSILESSNPLSCSASWTANSLIQKSSQKKKPYDTLKNEKFFQGLDSIIKTPLKFCSMPITGNIEAIAKKAISFVGNDPWRRQTCTPWGGILPRMSSQVKSDYNFANAALRFKYLAEDLFSVKTGEEEKWQLVYPWEEGGNFLGFNIPFIKNSARSNSLFSVGDPSLVDGSLFDQKNAIENFGKELAYIASLSGAGLIAGKAFDSEIKNQNQEYEKIFKEQENNNMAIPSGKQPVYKKTTSCTVTARGRVYFSSQNVNEDTCLDWDTHWGCGYKGVGMDEYEGRCAFFHIENKFVEKMEIVGWRTTKHPNYKKYVHQCTTKTDIGKVDLFWLTGKDSDQENRRDFDYFRRQKVSCKDVEIGSVASDNRTIVARPTTENTLKENESKQILKMAAMAAPWVSAEIIRNKSASMTGKNFLPGKKRIYAVWEKVQCTGQSKRYVDNFEVFGGVKMKKYNSCSDAIRYEVRKKVQKKYIRRFCDFLGYTAGKPFR